MATMSEANGMMSVPTAFLEKFPTWKNFPSGLHILALDEDKVSLRHSQSQLEACSYSVIPFSDRRNALEALQHQSKTFHLALIEVNISNAAEAFDTVRVAKHLPTVLLSSTKDVSLMMEGIAAGASEFLEKPLSEEKAKNLWQHVFRKALVTGELVVPKQEAGNDPVTVNETLAHNSGEEECHVKEEPIDPSSILDDTMYAEDDGDQAFFEDLMDGDHLEGKELESLPDVKPDASKGMGEEFVAKSPGPSTPQLEQAETRAINVSDDESPQSQDFAGISVSVEDVNSSDDCNSFVHVKSEMGDIDRVFQSSSEGDEFQSLHDFECFDVALKEGEDVKACDTFDFHDSLALADELVDELSSCLDMDSSILDELPSADSLQMSLDCLDDEDQRDEEALLLAEVAKAEAGMATNSSNNSMSMASTYSNISGNEGKSSLDQSGKGSKSMHSSKKKMKVDWTPELHRRFVQAVEQLGVDKAIPSRILEIMGVQHLTRHNIASHLQKYRSHKKHIQAREAEAATWNQRRQMEAVMQPPQPPAVSMPAPPLVPMGLHVWGHPTPEHYWPKPWQASADGSIWHQPAPVCLDAWGHPAAGTPFFHPSHGPTPLLRLPLAPIPGAINRVVPVSMPMEKPMPGFHLPKDKVDAAIGEVLKDPFAPLPLGLKPPSLESVLSELQRQGIKTVPPTPR